MKRKLIVVSAILLVALLACVSLVACNENDAPAAETAYRFSAPEGTPALAMLRLVTDNASIDGHAMEYSVVKPANIASEMSSKASDLVIMPVNAGANLIRLGADYKLVGIAVDGSLYMVGTTASGGEITLDDVKGKRVACIGQTGVPGLVFRYVMKANGIELVDENTTPSSEQVSVRYAADGTAAAQLLQGGQVDFMVVGEPAASAQTKRLSLNAEMDMQAEYAKVSGVANYPQAGLFVKSEIAQNQTFMDALFDALAQSKSWIAQNNGQVDGYAKEHLYESAVFPAFAVTRCAVNATRLDDVQKAQVITFLEKVMSKDAQGNDIDWQSAKSLIFQAA